MLCKIKKKRKCDCLFSVQLHYKEYIFNVDREDMTDTILMSTTSRTTRSELVVCLPVLLYHHIIFLYYIDFLNHCGFPCTDCTQRRISAAHRVSAAYYN